MSKSVLLEQALVLPAIDIAAMLRGQLIVAIPRVQIAKGLSFLLCPEQSGSQNEIVRQYRSPFLPLAEVVISQNQDEKVQVEAWATCEQTQMIHDVDQLSTLSLLTVWNRSYLESLLKERQYLFLSHLKVHRLSNWITLPTEKVSSGKLGKFIGLSDEEPKLNFEPVKITDVLPILSDRLFVQRKEQLENLKPPDHPELEELQSAIAHYAKDHPKTKDFNRELQVFLGWADPQNQSISSLENDWMQKIKAYGYRDDETTENRKSNYQAGTDFEIIIRKSLEFLGFTVDEAHAGGAGGIDIFCSAPYSLVGECKCGKGIPDSTVEQLDRIAKRHLKERYETASRFIIGPGNPSAQLLESAKLPTTSIMSPETLQKLVEFHNQYPINLLELREKCLVAGQVDGKVDEFLVELTGRIRIRSHIVQSVKALKNDGDNFVTASTVRTHFNTAFASSLEKLENPEKAYTLLIELSSPLTGYLGRKQYQGKDWKADRFYFLRDLMV